MAVSARAKAFAGTPGLELYSVRRELEKDFEGTLRLVRRWGFSEVETPQLYGRGAADLRRIFASNGLQSAALVAQGALLRTRLGQVADDAHALGAAYVICPWIDHNTPQLERADCLKAAAEFNRWGAALAKSGLRFCYHAHGYEFGPSGEGTILDTLLAGTDAETVHYQMDTFWIAWAGQRPEILLRKYPGRFPLMHLKDVRRGAKGSQTGQAPESASVALGRGSLDFHAILAAAREAGVRRFYIEDESPHAVEQIPESLKFLQNL